MSNDKSDALELAYNLSVAAVDGTLCASMGHDAATVLRSQVAEIDLYREKYNGTYGALDDCARSYSLIEAERDQLKAKNEKLVDALEELMGWQVKNGTAWSNTAYDYASKVLKENI